MRLVEPLALLLGLVERDAELPGTCPKTAKPRVPNVVTVSNGRGAPRTCSQTAKPRTPRKVTVNNGQ
jgi:hypothetical protein